MAPPKGSSDKTSRSKIQINDLNVEAIQKIGNRNNLKNPELLTSNTKAPVAQSKTGCGEL